ncbi:MAG: Tat pathway signal protein [Gemmatimonadaceae bacterium]
MAALGASAALLGVRKMGSSSEYNDATRIVRLPLSAQPETRDLIRYATLAPNSHNTQAWRFALSPNHIAIKPDFSRRTPAVDPDDHHLFVSLGCAAENLALAAAARGHSGELRYTGAHEGSIEFAYTNASPTASVLFDAIPARQSTRADYDGRTVGVADLNTLSAAAAIPGVDLLLITDRPQRDRIRDLVLAGNTTQLGDATFVRELKSWVRFSPRRAIATGDGLYSATTGNPSLPEWLGPLFFDMLVTAKSENEKYAAQVNSSAGVAIFFGARDDREHWALTGRSCQRFALQATALGLKHAFINQPVEIAALRPELASLLGMRGRRPDIVMRFGYGPTLPYSMRRPVETVLDG